MTSQLTAHTTKRTAIAHQSRTHETLHRYSTWQNKRQRIRHLAANTVFWTHDDERVTLETCTVLPSNKEHKKLHLVGYLCDHYIYCHFTDTSFSLLFVCTCLLFLPFDPSPCPGGERAFVTGCICTTLQVWIPQLGICKISKTNVLICPLKHVQNYTTSTCCLWFTSVVGGKINHF